MIEQSYKHGDWVRYKGFACRVLGYWHDDQFGYKAADGTWVTDWRYQLVLGIPRSVEPYGDHKQVASWRSVGVVDPNRVELIKRRPK